MHNLGKEAESLVRDPMSPFNSNKGFRTPVKSGMAQSSSGPSSVVAHYERTIGVLQGKVAQLTSALTSAQQQSPPPPAPREADRPRVARDAPAPVRLLAPPR